MKILCCLIYTESVTFCVIQKLQLLIFGLKRVGPKVSFICVTKTFQQMQYMDLYQLINAIESVEHLTLKNLKLNLFREDGEAGKVQKEKKTAVLFSSVIHCHFYFTKSYN